MLEIQHTLESEFGQSLGKFSRTKFFREFSRTSPELKEAAEVLKEATKENRVGGFVVWAWENESWDLFFEETNNEKEFFLDLLCAVAVDYEKGNLILGGLVSC